MNRSTFGLNETPSYIIRNTINDWDFLDDFLRALRKVDSGYYMYPIKDDNGKTDRKYPERVFAYEFYHQYRKIMEGKRDVYSGLYLNGEQTVPPNADSVIRAGEGLQRRLDQKDSIRRKRKPHTAGTRSTRLSPNNSICH